MRDCQTLLEKKAVWEPLNIPGVRMPGILRRCRPAPRSTMAHLAIAAPNWPAFLAQFKPIDYPENGPAAGNTSVLSSRRFPEL